jgi:predicted transposase/invertase (TIGR01784 family)
MSDKGIAIDYFQNYLPAFVSKQLDFTTLTQLPDVYVSGALEKTMSDIVYSCQRKSGKGEVKVSLLIEHKSYPDKYTPVQIGSYIFSGYIKQIQTDKKLSIIIPLLLYHGKGKWRYKTLADLFKNPEPEWRQFVPDFRYIYNNLGEISDQEVAALRNKFLAASFLALMHSRKKHWVEQNALRLLILSEGVSENLQQSLFVYLFGQNKVAKHKVAGIVESLPFTLKKSVMNIFDHYVRKGHKEGRQEEREKLIRNLLKIANLTDKQIAKAAGVTLAYVAKIRAEL